VVRLWAIEGRAELSRAAILIGLGYGSDNGSSQAALSAVRKFGLVAKNGDTYRVTQRAELLANPSSVDDKIEALEKALWQPSIFAVLLDRFGDRLPTDDDLAAYLVSVGFSETALPILISSFRESVEFVRANRSAIGTSDQGRPVAGDPFKVTMSGDRVEASAVLTDRRSLDRFIAALEVSKTILPP